MQNHVRVAAATARGRRITWVLALSAALIVGLMAALAVATAVPARAQEQAPAEKQAEGNADPAFVHLRAGFIGDIVADRDSGGWFAFEFRGGPDLELFRIRPSLGLGAATNASAYIWTALNLDVYFGRRLVLTPSTGIGAYRDGDGQDLGSVLEFRNGVDLAWRFDSRARLGVGFHYMSNYGIGDDDPGIGSVTLFFAQPLGDILP